MSYFIIEYFDDYEISKSLEKNDINITFIQRNIFQISKIKKLKVFYSILFSRIYFSNNNIKEQFQLNFIIQYMMMIYIKEKL